MKANRAEDLVESASDTILTFRKTLNNVTDKFIA